MSGCSFIGDAVTAAGFRLAGIQVFTPSEADTEACFRTQCEHCDLLIITAQSARALPPALLRQTLDRGLPLLLTVADAQARAVPTDLAESVARRMGAQQ